MTDHALSLLLRQRLAALDEARARLAEAVAGETTLDDQRKAIERDIQRETDTVECLDTPDALVEAFASWLRAVRAEQRVNADALRQAEERTQEARTVLAACRAAVSTVEKLLEERAAAERRIEERVAQRSLDEIKH